jgi:hypothetical protein
MGCLFDQVQSSSATYAVHKEYHTSLLSLDSHQIGTLTHLTRTYLYSNKHTYIHPSLPPLHHASALPFPFSAISNFRRAAKTISSLLRCKFACRSFRSALHALGFACSAGSSVCCNLAARLYRVMRSGCAVFGAGDARGAVCIVGSGRGVGRLNDGGACSALLVTFKMLCWCLRRTVSSPRPLNTRSVVAAAFPPFRCRSHAMSRRLSCGNICAMSSICRWFRRGAAARVEVGRVPWADGLLKYQRMARKVTTRKTRTWGMLIDCSVMVALCVVWCGVEVWV